MNSGEIYIYNNIVFDVTSADGTSSGHGMKFGDLANFHAKNNYVGKLACNSCTYGAVAFRDATTGAINTDNNVSYDASADDFTGANNQIDKTSYASYFANVTAGNENFHLLADSNTLWGTYGQDVDADPILPVTVDIDGDARDSTQPDIGADEMFAAAVSFVRAGSVTGTSLTNFDIGSAGTQRLVVVIADDETAVTNLTGVTVDTKACSLVTRANNTDSAGNHQEMWYCDESDLGTSSGLVTVAIAGGDTGWGTHVHLYTGVSQSGPTDWGIDETSVGLTTATVPGIDVPANGLVVMGAGHGDSDAISTWTSPLAERGAPSANPSSAVLVSASAVETSAQTNKTYVATFVSAYNRATGIVGVWPNGTDVSVSTTGSQTSSLFIPSTNQYVGGTFVITENTSSRNVTGITITEMGTVDALNNLSNVRLYYETAADCSAQTFSDFPTPTETLFGSATTFDGSDEASFTGSVAISTGSEMCVYAVVDVGAGAVDNQTLELEISNPSTKLIFSVWDFIGTSAVALTGTTNLDTPPDLQQIHYRWRNDDGGEASPVFDSDAAMCLVNNGGPLAQAGVTYNTTGTANNIWTDGTYIYAADGASGLHAFTFDGTNFTLIDTYNSAGTAFDVWGDGTYIYLAGRFEWCSRSVV